MRELTDVFAGASLAFLALISGCGSNEFTASQTDGSAGGASGASGGATAGGAAGTSTGTSGGGGTTSGGGSGGATGGGAGGGTQGGTAGVSNGGTGATDAGSKTDASLPCPQTGHWCDADKLWGCTAETGNYVVKDCTDAGQICRGSACVSSCEPGANGCDCLSSNGCNAGLVCVSNTCQPVDTPEPLAHWAFNGDLTDSSGNGYDATEVGTITYTISSAQTGAVTTEGYGRADSFADPFKSVLGGFTLSVRLKVEAYDRYMPIFSLQGSGSDSFLTNKWLLELCSGLYCGSSAPLGVVVETETGDAGSNHYDLLGPVPPVGEWATLTLVVEGDKITYYVDGQLVSSTFYTPTETAADRIYLGGLVSSSETLNGAIDDLRVYGTALSAAQVAAVYQQMQP